MTMKDWCKSLRPIQLYVVMALTVAFLLAEMVVSHTTHALTLLVDAYHMMCNIISLMGCVVNLKYADLDHQPCSSERRLKNTFGWARVDVVMMLSGGVVLASLCFSVVVEALQTLVHIGHQHQMHQPILILTLGAVGLLLNGLCYLLIGGYTFHQSSFLHVTKSGDVVLDKVTSPGDKGGAHPQMPSRPALPARFSQRQETREIALDITGCVLVMICSLVVYFTDECVAKYVDPALAILSSVILVVLSAPYMKESGLILLQTMPDAMNIDALREDLLKAFPGVLNVHDLHVWRLTASKVYTTAHVVFLSAKDYPQITKEITDFFREHGVTHITLQPEFYKMNSGSLMTALPSNKDTLCLVKCKSDWCHAQHCCANISSDEPDTVVVSPDKHGHGHGHSHGGHGHGHGGHGHSHGHKSAKKNKSEQKKADHSANPDNPKKQLDISYPISLKTLETSIGEEDCENKSIPCDKAKAVNDANETNSEDVSRQSETKVLPRACKETFEIGEGESCRQ